MRLSLRVFWYVVAHLVMVKCSNDTGFLNLDFSKSPPNDEQQLLRFILRAYDKSVRPVWNASQTVVIQVGLTLTQIFNIAWTDERLRWNPDDFGGVSLLTVPTRFVWTPDIVLLNNAEDFSHGIAQTNVNVYPDGSLLWAPPIQSHSVCKLNVALFPFDQQICILRYASWTYDASQVDVTNRSSKINMDSGSFIENGEWHVVNTRSRRNVQKHPYYSVEYADVTFTLYLRRRVLYYMYNIICPCAMLSSLTLLQFWLPCESGEKVTLGLTVLLAYSVFSFNIGEKLPETSDVIPLIAIYLTCIMGISSISVGFSVAVLNINHAGEDNYKAPRWLRFVAIRIIAPIVRWRNSRENRMLRRWLAMEKNFCQTYRSLSAHIAATSFTEPACDPVEKRESGASAIAEMTSFPGQQPEPRITAAGTSASKSATVQKVSTNGNEQEPALAKFVRVLEKLEGDLKHEQLMHEWRKIAQIFDRLFFWLIASVTVAWSVVMLGVAPVFSYSPMFEE